MQVVLCLEDVAWLLSIIPPPHVQITDSPVVEMTLEYNYEA